MTEVSTPVAELEQRRGGMIDGGAGAEFHLGCEPSAVAELADDVGFEAGAVAVVEQLAPVGLGVDPQVAHDECFEQQTEQAMVGVEPLGACSQCSDRE